MQKQASNPCPRPSKGGSPRSALGQNGKSGVAQPLKLHRSFRSAPGQKVGTPILAFQAIGGLIVHVFALFSQGCVPDPGAPPGNRACWGIMKNDEVPFFWRCPPPSLGGPRFGAADSPKSAYPEHLLYNVPRFSTPLGPLNRPTGARK